MKQNESVITGLLLFLTMVSGFSLLMAEDMNINLRIILFIIFSLIFIITFIIIVAFYSEPQKELDFIFTVAPGNTIMFDNIRSKKGIRLIWSFKNNTGQKIDTIRYILLTTKDEIIVGNQPWQYKWSITIPPKDERTHRWNYTDPLGYKLGVMGRGVYELHCVVVYRFQNGEKNIVGDTQKITIV